jgi:hypothetical protein
MPWPLCDAPCPSLGLLAGPADWQSRGLHKRQMTGLAELMGQQSRCQNMLSDPETASAVKRNHCQGTQLNDDVVNILQTFDGSSGILKGCQRRHLHPVRHCRRLRRRRRRRLLPAGSPKHRRPSWQPLAWPNQLRVQAGCLHIYDSMCADTGVACL